MDKEINLHRLRLVIRGALDYLNRDGGDINEALTAQGKVKLTVTMESIETALLWLRRMVEDALNDEEKKKSECSAKHPDQPQRDCNLWKGKQPRTTTNRGAGTL